jgi:predicted PurR-regulated permease PerM
LLGNLGAAVGKIREVFAITLEVVEDFAIFFFLTLYLAFNPDIYIRGIVKLVPIDGRETAAGIIQALGSTLKWWLIGRFATMTLVGIMSGLGLWLLGIPLALTLGILAGLLTFIPYIGAIISGLPAILIALLISVSHAVYVIFLYIGIHSVEGYILAPLIQERVVFVPPMLLLSALIGLTILLGVPGLILATPLTAVSMVLINKIYIEGILGDKPDPSEITR